MAESDSNSSKMRFQIISRVSSSGSGPRNGKIIVPNRSAFPTPSHIPLTSRGVIPHLAPDTVQEDTKVREALVSLEDFLERNSPPIFSLPEPSSTTISPLHRFLAFSPQTLTVLAPRRVPPIPCPASNTNSAVSVHTSVGYRSLDVSRYADAIRAMKPDIAISLVDLPNPVILGDKDETSTPQGPSIKRIEKMLDRTEQWTIGLLSDLSMTSPRTNVFVSLLPLALHQQTIYLSRLADTFDADSQVPPPAGLTYYSLDLLKEDNGTSTLPRPLQALPRLSLAHLPSDTPHSSLPAIGLGIDILTCPWINAASDAGWALTFALQSSDSKSTREPAEKLPLVLDMHSPGHATSTAPLVEGCDCYTCVTHPRAFVTHLLAAKEMLAWTLLQIHNLAMAASFFADVRAAIEADRFEQARESFRNVYEESWPTQIGEGPRLRGYQVKNLEVGKKVNERTWGRFGEGGPREGGRFTATDE